ncbi:hypothetical protein DRH29_04415 [candidate division Kazan bacterium]|uniref:Uncharacterized protein n=1 Tax=candidate division Kazan bacterium TaxID=2202143 RepID=A0A420ZBP9_UNCK3|nr:MAG: hypothetical protein DRH29_04415 [candidate division Kazan bacterium]
MSKKILINLSIIGVVAAIVAGGTIAYFSDTETSAGNKFAVGKLNLKVDSACHYNGAECICVTNSDSPHYGNCYWDIGGNGQFGDGEVSEDNRCYCSWQEKDLGQNDLFFNFDDVKPGDNGEDTVSLHIINNDAWLCAQISNLASNDNGCDDPESKIDATCGEGEGELQDNLFFTVWRDDDCDNVLDSGEDVLVDYQPASEGLWPLADSANGSPVPGEATVCYGIKWEVPISASNIIQSDSLEGDISFTAVQARHMNDFKCSDLTGGGNNPECVQDTDCNDNNPCTNDICESGECIHSSISGIPCDDGNPCTIEDMCLNGECVGTPKSCDDGNFCTTDSCNETTGECEHQCNVNVPCDDGNPNTIEDKCQLVDGSCQCAGQEAPECTQDSDCDDGYLCTNDKCVGGECTHTDTGFCGIYSAMDSCKTAYCNPGNTSADDNGCVVTSIEDGTSCTSINCMMIDNCSGYTCLNGVCTAPNGGGGNSNQCTYPDSSSCIDNNECTIDLCSEENICVHIPSVGPCDNGAGVCVGGQCIHY